MMKIIRQPNLRPIFLFLILWFMVGWSARGDDSPASNAGDTSSIHTASAITLDHIDGLHTDDTILTGQDIVLYFRVSNTSSHHIAGFTNGFRVYSPDSANWNTTRAHFTKVINRSLFDLILLINKYGVTGKDADTIGFGGAKLGASGIPPGFDDVAFTIKVGPIALSEAGKRLCIDTAWYPPSNTWTWSWSGGGIKPTWEGKRCFTIANPPPWPDEAPEID